MIAGMHAPLAPTEYKTANWSTCSNALNRRGPLAIWLDPEMIRTPPPGGKHRRRQRFSEVAIQTCLKLKVPLKRPLGQTTGFVQSLLRLVGLD